MTDENTPLSLSCIGTQIIKIANDYSNTNFTERYWPETFILDKNHRYGLVGHIAKTYQHHGPEKTVKQIIDTFEKHFINKNMSFQDIHFSDYTSHEDSLALQIVRHPEIKALMQVKKLLGYSFKDRWKLGKFIDNNILIFLDSYRLCCGVAIVHHHLLNHTPFEKEALGELLNYYNKCEKWHKENKDKVIFIGEELKKIGNFYNGDRSIS